MSTTTNFKRIALVAVAALGMGVLSSVPSQAVVPVSSLTLTASATAGTAAVGGGNGASSNIGAISDSTTGATVTVSFLGVTANTDSVSLTIAPKSKPALQTTYPQALFTLVDTSSSTTIPLIETTTAGGLPKGQHPTVGITDSSVAMSIGVGSTANRYVTASFKIHMDSATARVAGTYVYTVIATPFDAATAGGAVSANVKSVDVTITVSAGSTVASQAYSSAVMTQGSTFLGVAGTTGVDSVVSVVSTASTAIRSVVRVTLRTATNTTTAQESVTVVATRGSIGTVSGGVALGKNVTLQYPVGTGYLDVAVFSDGTAGSGTITISTASVAFAAKTITFYATDAAKLSVIAGTTVLGTGSNTMTRLGVGVIWVKATDANGNTVVANADGDSGVWAYSSDKTVVTDSGTACTYNSTIGYHTCALTGALAGKSTITIKNSGTNFNAATLSGDKTVEVTVLNSTADKLVMEFNKASYAPGEKGYILISAKDVAGNTLPAGALTNLMASGGISLTGSFSGTAPTLTEVTYNTSVRVASIDSPACDSAGKAVACLEFFAPYAGTSMKITATGGSLLPVANRVAVTATASVADSGAAALAAVTALATTVASLKTLITTLTNLVLKIQKKVKA